MRKGKLFEGDVLIMEAFQEAVLDDGRKACEACLFELITDSIRNPRPQIGVYEAMKVKLNTVFSGDVKEYKIYVEDPQNSDIKRIDFGAKNGKRSNGSKPRRFRTVHKCGDPSDPKSQWSCLKNNT